MNECGISGLLIMWKACYFSFRFFSQGKSLLSVYIEMFFFQHSISGMKIYVHIVYTFCPSLLLYNNFNQNSNVVPQLVLTNERARPSLAKCDQNKIWARVINDNENPHLIVRRVEVARLNNYFSPIRLP